MLKKLVWGIAAVTVAFSVYAQKPAVKKPAAKSKLVVPSVATYLANTSMSGGMIGKRTFDSLIRRGISARDSAGKAWKVQGFQFTYAERGIYEDSVGNAIMTTDYLTEYCFGDTLSRNISLILPSKTKPGDTVFVERVKVIRPAGGEAVGKPMRFILTR